MKINRTAPLRSLLPDHEPDPTEAVIKEATADRRKDGYLTDDAIVKLWYEHKNTPEEDTRARNIIVKELKGFRHKAVNSVKNSPIPKGVADQKALEIMHFAIDNWKPDGGASLRTYVHESLFPGGVSSLRKLLGKHSIDGKSITGDRAKRISEARETIQEFELMNGRPPSETELVDMLGMNIDQVRKMKRNLQNSFTMEQQIDDTFVPPRVLTPQMRDAINTVYGSLVGNEREIMRQVFYPHLGGGPAHEHHKDIAKQLGISEPRVTEIKKKIIKLVGEST